MGRPPIHKPLGKQHHICTWVHQRGTRGLYAEQRGQFVQAQISGYSMRPHRMICHSFFHLANEVRRLSSAWGPGWTLKGCNPRSKVDQSRQAQAMVEARAGQ